MTYLWAEGNPVEVETNPRGLPLRLLWCGQLHTVHRIASRWRVDEGWWLGRIWREYFKLTTDTGLLLTLFQDIENNEWFIQRLYD